MKILIIQPTYPYMEDTKSFMLLNEIKGHDVKVVSTADDMEKDCDMVIACGHGSPDGLFGSDMTEYTLNEKHVEFLKTKLFIGIWCYATDFGKANQLTGFFTDMFISNTIEADLLEVKTDERSIEKEMELFVCRIKQLLEEGECLENFANRLSVMAEPSELNDFNYGGISFLKNGEEYM